MIHLVAHHHPVPMFAVKDRVKFSAEMEENQPTSGKLQIVVDVTGVPGVDYQEFHETARSVALASLRSVGGKVNEVDFEEWPVRDDSDKLIGLKMKAVCDMVS